MIIAQISDIHIKPPGRLAYRRVDTAEAFARCVAHLNRLDPQPDVVLVTGDLVDAGVDGEYGLFREVIAPLRLPYFVIPGNHDERAAMRRAFADSRYLPKDGGFLHYAVEDFPIRLIGLDTTVPGAPHGELCPERLRWLDQALRREPERPTLLFMHHPPFRTGIEHMDVQNCRHGEALAEIVGRHGQLLAMLCGHVHRFVATRWHGLAASICPGTSHAVALDLRPGGPPNFAMEPPGLLLHRWADGILLTHQSFIDAFDGPYPFFDEAGRLID